MCCWGVLLLFLCVVWYSFPLIYLILSLPKGGKQFAGLAVNAVVKNLAAVPSKAKVVVCTGSRREGEIDR